MQVDPRTLSRGERYNLLTGVIIPRPIAWVSTLAPSGVTNVAPYSFFTGAGADPMALMFCPTVRDDGSDKDTLRNLLPPAEGGLGEFVVNASVQQYAPHISATAANLPPEESEFDAVGLTPADCAVVRPPRVAESPVSFECKTLHVIRLAPGVPTSGIVVIGEVVHAWVDDDIVGERMHIDARKLDPLGRLAGGLYTGLGETFSMVRGLKALTTS